MNNNLSPINDETTRIFDEICAEQFEKLKLDVLNLSNVDILNEDVLPHLAEQYHITGNEGWIFCQTTEEKRTFIKNSIKLHATRGTKYAILKALELLNIDVNLLEWFEYNGKPYNFKVTLTTEETFPEELEIVILDLIKENKNVRSWLEALEVFLQRRCSVTLASCVISSEEWFV